MKKTFAKIMCVAIVALMIVSCFASCGNNKNYAENNTEYYIGVSGPLTGGAAVYGTAVNNGAQLAVDEINAAGGLGGVKFKLVALDDKHDPTNVSTNYAQMIEGGMQVSLGCVTSGPCLEFKNLSLADNLFFLTPSASNDTVPANPNGYQLCFVDGNQGKAAAEYVNDNFKNQTIGVIFRSDDNYSTGILEQFKDNLDSSVTLIETSFQGESPASFDSQIDTLKNCKFVFMPIYYTPASQFMVQAKNKIAADAVYYGCDGLDGIESVSGFDIYTIPQEVSYLSHFNSKATEGPAAAFIAKYTQRFGADTLNQFGAAAYDCVYAIYGAMKQAYEADNTSVYVTMSPSELCEVLKGVFNGNFVFTGVTGEYRGGVQTSMTWESNGFVNKSATKYVVKEAGETAPVTQ